MCGIREAEPVDVTDALDPGLINWLDTLGDWDVGKGIPGVLMAELTPGARIPLNEGFACWCVGMCEGGVCC